MKKTIGMMMLLIAVAGFAFAGLPPETQISAPEINPSAAGSAVGLLGGTLLILRSRVKK